MIKVIVSLLFTVVLMLSQSVSAAKPKYVFLFIGDGMGMGHVMAAETYNRISYGSNEPLLMMQFPVSSFAMTYSASSTITDSAAAGTALACGTKTKNSMLGVDADTVAVTSVATELKQKYGYGVGLVTSVAFDDATPAAHYAHCDNRHKFTDINYHGARSNFDFIGGAGTHQAERGSKESIEKIYSDYEANGFTIVRGIDAYTKSAKKVLFTPEKPLNPNEIGFAIDSLPGATSLQEMTQLCLDHLKKVSPKNFFMMVEGGNIDHAGHGNAPGSVVKEIINFQESIKVAYNFYKQHPNETLIVITADHDTGGLTIGVKDGNSKIDAIKNLDYQRISKEQFSDLAAKEIGRDWAGMKELIAEKLGLFNQIAVNEIEEARMLDSFGKVKAGVAKGNKTLYKEYNNFAETVFDIFNHKAHFGFTTGSHTGNPVPVFAIGVGADQFKCLNNNIDIPAKFRKLTGLN